MKTLKYIFPVLIAVSAIVGCQKETISGGGEKGNELCVTVSADFVAPSNEEGTRTTMVDDGTDPYAKWLPTDKIKLWEFMDGEQKNYFLTTNTTLSADGKTATFTLLTHGTDSTVTNYTYTAIYPEDGVNKGNNFYYFEIPAAQTLNGSNFDPAADIMIGKPQNRASRLTELENLNFQFKRPGTIVKLTLKGITASEKISAVIVTAPSDNKIAGRCKVNMLTGAVPEDTKAYYGGTNIITLSCDITATGNDVVFFRCIDGTWASGSEVSIKVTTDQAEYTKTSTLTKDYVFADGGLTRFGFKDMTRTEGLATYQKYTGELIEGDYIICSGTTAMKNAISSDRMTYETVTVTNDQIKTNDSTKIWHIAEDGDYWTLYNAAVNKYAASTGDKNKMALSDTKDIDKAKWTATYSSGWEFVNKQNSASSVNANLRYNSGYGFACYGTGTSSSLTIYINSGDLKDPLSTPVITVTGNNFAKTISVEWDVVSNATGYEISCTGQDKISTTETSCQFSGLTAGEYSVTVKAIDNTGTYRSSKATTGCTLYDPAVTLSTTSIINVPAAGDIRDDITYTISHAEETDLEWTCDGTIVSEVSADNGTVTYTVAANTTADARNGWIKISLNGDEQTITVGQLAQGGKQDQNITFSQASYTVKMGETITQTVSGAQTAVTYSSSDTEIATVDQDGKVTPVAAGSCTIYAVAEEDETYNAAQTSYELTVQAAVKTYNHTFTTKPSTGTTTLSGMSWSISATALNGYNNGYAGVQFGSSKVSGNITLTSSASWSYQSTTKVKEIRVWLNTGGGTVTPTVTIGGTAVASDGTTVSKKSSLNGDYTKANKVTFTPSSSMTGVIVISVASSLAGYICAIEVDSE